jgi:hypothetical protein
MIERNDCRVLDLLPNASVVVGLDKEPKKEEVAGWFGNKIQNPHGQRSWSRRGHELVPMLKMIFTKKLSMVVIQTQMKKIDNIDIKSKEKIQWVTEVIVQ